MQANGDGLAVGIEAGGAVVDTNLMQLHPTAFIDPQDPTNPTKVNVRKRHYCSLFLVPCKHTIVRAA